MVVRTIGTSPVSPVLTRTAPSLPFPTASNRADANMAGHTVVLWAAKQNPAVKATYTYKTGLVWAMPFRLDDKEGRAKVNNELKCLKLNGTVARLYEKWFGIKPASDSWVHKIAPGHGVPGMDGYDPGPYPPKC